MAPTRIFLTRLLLLRQLARVDLDVLQIRILGSLVANVFAEYVYMYGTNMFDAESLSREFMYVRT